LPFRLTPRSKDLVPWRRRETPDQELSVSTSSRNAQDVDLGEVLDGEGRDEEREGEWSVARFISCPFV